MIRKNKKSIKRFIHNPKILIAAVLVVGIIIGVVMVIVSKHEPSTSGSATSATDETVSSVPANKSNAATNSTGSSNSVSQGGAIDRDGISSTSSPSSQWKSSSSGLITLWSPVAGSTLRPGDTISGTAKTSDVQYRLVDDTVGELAKGSLSVVNGKFAGIIQFNPHGTTGSLDIFSYDTDYKEINRVEINLKLGS